MSEIEAEYRSGLAGWTGQQRVMRSAELLSEMQQMLTQKVRLSDPSLNPREVQIRVAECLYRDDPETLKLIAALDR